LTISDFEDVANTLTCLSHLILPPVLLTQADGSLAFAEAANGKSKQQHHVELKNDGQIVGGAIYNQDDIKQWLQCMDHDNDGLISFTDFFMNLTTIESKSCVQEKSLGNVNKRETLESKSSIDASVQHDASNLQTQLSSDIFNILINCLSLRKLHLGYVVFEIWENQRFYVLIGWSSNLLPTDRSNFSDDKGLATLHFNSTIFRLPGHNWKWDDGFENGWKCDYNLQDLRQHMYQPAGKESHRDQQSSHSLLKKDFSYCDAEGWQYAADFSLFGMDSTNDIAGGSGGHAKQGILDFCRRRRWIRKCILKDALET
jgi:hypothetical protein